MSGAALLATVLLLLLSGGAALLHRRLARAESPDALGVAGRVAPSRESGVALLRVRGDLLLVGWGRNGVRLLSRLEREDAP